MSKRYIYKKIITHRENSFVTEHIKTDLKKTLNKQNSQIILSKFVAEIEKIL